MMKFPTLLITISVLLLILLGLLYMWPFTKKPKIVETRIFSCPGMTGFTFEYPVFEGWDYSKPKAYNGECQIFLTGLAMSDSAVYEVAPQIRITIRKGMLVALSKKEKSPNNVFYTQKDNWLEFFFNENGGTGSTVVELLSLRGFPEDTFFKTVIESFRLIDSIAEKQAYEIAEQDLTKSLLLVDAEDLGSMSKQSKLLNSVWHIDYIFTSFNTKLPKHIYQWQIDEKSGEIKKFSDKDL